MKSIDSKIDSEIFYELKRKIEIELGLTVFAQVSKSQYRLTRAEAMLIKGDIMERRYE
jgi:hypothetical protein